MTVAPEHFPTVITDDRLGQVLQMLDLDLDYVPGVLREQDLTDEQIDSLTIELTGDVIEPTLSDSSIRPRGHYYPANRVVQISITTCLIDVHMSLTDLAERTNSISTPSMYVRLAEFFITEALAHEIAHHALDSLFRADEIQAFQIHQNKHRAGRRNHEAPQLAAVGLHVHGHCRREHQHRKPHQQHAGKTVEVVQPGKPVQKPHCVDTSVEKLPSLSAVGWGSLRWEGAA